MRRIAALTFAALAALAAPSHATPEDVAERALAGYRANKALGMLQAERACWAAASRATAGVCVQQALAGMLVDVAMQHREGRGGAPSFTGPAIEARIDAELARIGLGADAAKAVKMGAADQVTAIRRALIDAGL